MELYHLAVNRFIAVCGDRPIDTDKPSDVEQFKNAQIEQKVSKISVNIWLRGVKSVLGFAVNPEWLTKNPVRGTYSIPYAACL